MRLEFQTSADIGRQRLIVPFAGAVGDGTWMQPEPIESHSTYNIGSPATEVEDVLEIDTAKEDAECGVVASGRRIEGGGSALDDNINWKRRLHCESTSDHQPACQS